MRKELDAKLVEKYPLIFKNRYGSMRDTAMCWGFECGDGWYNIIDVLCDMMYSKYRQAKERYENLLKWKEEGGAYPWKGGKEITNEEIAEAKAKMEEEAELIPVAAQVKEKFGGLRFYVDNANEKHYNYIAFAENMSYKTCEHCGNPGKYYPLGWHTTLCDTHADEQYGEEAEHFRNKTGDWSEEE